MLRRIKKDFRFRKDKTMTEEEWNQLFTNLKNAKKYLMLVEQLIKQKVYPKVRALDVLEEQITYVGYTIYDFENIKAIEEEKNSTLRALNNNELFEKCGKNNAHLLNFLTDNGYINEYEIPRILSDFSRR